MLRGVRPERREAREGMHWRSEERVKEPLVSTSYGTYFPPLVPGEWRDSRRNKVTVQL